MSIGFVSTTTRVNGLQWKGHIRKKKNWTEFFILALEILSPKTPFDTKNPPAPTSVTKSRCWFSSTRDFATLDGSLSAQQDRIFRNGGKLLRGSPRIRREVHPKLDKIHHCPHRICAVGLPTSRHTAVGVPWEHGSLAHIVKAEVQEDDPLKPDACSTMGRHSMGKALDVVSVDRRVQAQV